jgi:hypothetical protein
MPKNKHNLPMLERGDLRLEWVNIDEGFNGDYDPSDAEDENLLRLDLMLVKSDEQVHNGSVCTQVNATAETSMLESFLLRMMNRIEREIGCSFPDKEPPAKHLFEEFSYVSLSSSNIIEKGFS